LALFYVQNPSGRQDLGASVKRHPSFIMAAYPSFSWSTLKIALPMGIDPEAASSWASTTIETHRNRIDKAADPSEVIKSFDAFVAHFDDDFVADVSNVLLWFSGKDILAGMTEWLNTKTFANPGAFRASMRDWVIGNPERTLELLPEWNNLTVLLKA
jgi:hypothetical protein